MNYQERGLSDTRALNGISGPIDGGPVTLLIAAAGVLRKQRSLLLTMALVGLLAAILYVVAKPAQYESEARIEVAPAGSNTLGLDELVSKAFSSSENAVQLQTAAQVLRSNTIAVDVMTKLGLPQRRDFAGKWTQPAGVDFHSIAPRERDRLIERFHRNFTAEIVPKTDLIALRFRAEDPRLAADVVNELVRCYRQRNFRSSYDSASEVSTWLATQTQELRDRARSAQERLAALDRRTGLIGVDETDNLVLKRLEQLTEQLTAAEGDRIVKEARYKLAANGDPEAISSTVQNPTLQLLRTQQAELQAQYSQMNAKFGKGYPKLAELSVQMSRLDVAIDSERKSLQERYRNDLKAAQQSERLLRASVDEQKQVAFQLNQGAAQRSILKRELESAQQLYETLELKLQEAGVAAGLASANVAIVDVAPIPSEPVEPKPAIDLFLGVSAGLGIGLIAAFGREAARDSVNTPEDAESTALAPVLAIVPLLSEYSRQNTLAGRFRNASSSARTSLAALEKPLSRTAESYRTLRSCLLLTTERSTGKVIVVTSPMPQEGKTLSASNCAVVLAQNGAKVLLLDADLRRPTIHTHFGTAREPGLTSLLNGELEDSDVLVRPSSLAKLSVVPSGARSTSPGELLSSNRLKELLTRWRSQFDYIVVDTPPVTVASDAVLLGAQADIVLVVVRSEETARSALRRTREALTRNSAPFTGIILNAARSRRGDRMRFPIPFARADAVSRYYSNADA